MAAGVQFDAVIVAASKMTERSEEALLAHELESRGVDVATADERVFDAVSPTRQPSGIAAIGRRRPSTPADLDSGALALVVVAAEIQDPGNLGGIIRAAEAGGATAVVATTGSANPYSWKALRGSMGSALRLPIVFGLPVTSVLGCLESSGVRTVASVARGGDAPDAVDWRGSVALIVGGEGPGLSDEIVARCSARTTIPMADAVESLNVAVAAGILAYAARRQRVAT
jgi:TrmH family RNA methyltransferase